MKKMEKQKYYIRIAEANGDLVGDKTAYKMTTIASSNSEKSNIFDERCPWNISNILKYVHI